MKKHLILFLFFLWSSNRALCYEGTKISIGSNHIEKILMIEDNKIIGGVLNNKIINASLGLEGNEFVISLCSGDTIYSNQLLIERVDYEERIISKVYLLNMRNFSQAM